MISADTLPTTVPFAHFAPGCPAETVYRPNLTKPDPRDVAIADLRAQAARNITTAELHHPGDCRKCAAEAAA